MHTQRLGFSLMEMLMVLLVVALISLSFFKLKQSHMEVDKAEDLGYRLFEYGQALGDFLRTEGKDYPATGPGPITYEGYEWLQEKGYLNKEFTLVVEPLYVENIPGKSTTLSTTIMAVDAQGEPGHYHLTLDMVEVGPVYSRNDVQTDEGGNRTAVQDVSLISRAVNYANEYRDNLKGSGVIQYRRVEVGTEPPPPGTEPPATPPSFSTPSIIQGTMVDQNTWNDAWLLRSGNNTMQGPINFETGTLEDSAINGINRIKFKTEGTGIAAISDVQTILFGAGGGISNIRTIDFINVDPGETNPGSVGTINNIHTINFASTGAGKLTGVKSIEFASGPSFEGIKSIGDFKCIGQTSGTRNCQVYINGILAKPNNYFCSLSYVDTRGGTNGETRCLLVVKDDYYQLSSAEKTECRSICFKYRD